MAYVTAEVPYVTIGLDLGDKFSQYFMLSSDGEIVGDGRVPSRPESFQGMFGRWPGARIVIEASTHSPWAGRVLSACGLEVLIANPRQTALISQSHRKNDRLDAEMLARLGRSDPELLRPIQPRGLEAQRDRAVLDARDAVVKQRAKLIVMVKGKLKSFGLCLKGVTTDNFHLRVPEQIPPDLAPALSGLLKLIQQQAKIIKAYDKEIAKLCDSYPQTARLREITGVGPVTSLAFLMRIEDPTRFKRSRDVGAYLGLTPAQHSSGESQPQLRISKTGDSMVRWLLVQCAHYILHRGPDSDIRRHGQAIAERGGKNARKRAIVAIARKLAVVMHRLLITDCPYDPLRNARKTDPPEASQEEPSSPQEEPSRPQEEPSRPRRRRR